MITEDYVSFETAKLLKEKGFPQEYNKYHSMVYNEEDYEDEYEVKRMVLETQIVKAGTLSSYPVGVPEPKCYCCTLQMAMKWLREVHKIYIDINIRIILEQWSGYNISIHKTNTNNYFLDKVITLKGLKDNTSYEQACEEAILYCLKNLI